MLKLPLSAEQCQQVEPHLRVGFALLGRITREAFDPAVGNSATSGRLILEAGFVPESSLPALRLAIQRANAPKGRARKAKTTAQDEA
jgi:hypothetical protein